LIPTVFVLARIWTVDLNPGPVRGSIFVAQTRGEQGKACVVSQGVG